MKVGVYHGPGDIRIEDRERPRPGPGEILLRVRACGLCGTDVAKYRLCLVKPPAVLGHEVAGEVVEVGPDVEHVAVGERIVVPHHMPCFTCLYCRHGNYSNCAAFRPNQFIPGGFAEYIRVGAPSVRAGVFKIPDNLSDDAAALAESLACCLRALKRSHFRAGDSLAVVGCGPVGLMHLMLARSFGAGVLIGVDVVPERLEAARRFGADATINAKDGNAQAQACAVTDGAGPDQVIVAAGNTAAVELGLRLARRGGTVNVFAECPPGSSVTLDPNRVYHAEVSLIGTYSSSPAEMAEALSLLARGRIDVEALITHRLPLARLQEGFHLATAGREALKIVIHPSGSE